ncbi:MAG: RDD family protein, partial [Deltaproteobacteria bacterium]|nr:RDD family protein [Deltaproteobacteria bacterium]
MNLDPKIIRAPLDRRVVAGCIDAAAVAALAAAAFFSHLLLIGMVMPLWTLSAIAVAWNVLPAWRWQATPGLWLVGLRLEGSDGERPDLLELTVRELIGRGLIAGAYIASLFVGVGGALLGLGGFNIPT